jgi:hypothetical protein
MQYYNNTKVINVLYSASHVNKYSGNELCVWKVTSSNPEFSKDYLCFCFVLFCFELRVSLEFLDSTLRVPKLLIMAYRDVITMRLDRIWEVPGSNTGRDTDYTESELLWFSLTFRQISGKYLN